MGSKLKNILSWIIKTCLFAVPFIPLYIATGLFFPFITGKAFIFRALVEIAFSLWIILAVFFKEYRPKKNGLVLAIGIFVLIVTLATIMGINPLRSFWSNFERMEGLITYLHLFAYFLVLGNVFKKNDWLVLFNLFVISGLIENGYGLMQAMGKIPSPQGGFRVDGTIGNPTYLAAYLIFILGFCIWLFMEAKNKYLKIYYALAGLFTLTIIYFTASRGPVLGILIALVLAGIGYLLFKKTETEGDRKIKKILFGGLVCLVAVVGALWGLRNASFIQNNEILSRLTNLSFSETTVAARFQIWNMSWQGFKERPILGWGPENYLPVFAKYYQPEMWRQEPWFDRSHDIIFDWLINAGALGLLSYLAIFFFAFRELYKNYQNKKISFERCALIIGIFIAYFFQNLFVFDNIATYASFFAILAWIYSVSTSRINADNQIQRGSAQITNPQKSASAEAGRAEFDINYFPLVVTAVFAVSIFYAYFITVKPYLANKNLLSAVASGNNYAAAFNYYKAAFNENIFLGRDETRGQFANFALIAAKDQQLDQGKKQEILELAAKELDDAKIQNPMDPRPCMYSGLFYEGIGQTDKAIENMEAAIKISPKKQDIVLNLAKLYLTLGQYDKAMPILLNTFQEDETNPDARIVLAGGYILAGRQDDADKLLMDGFGTVKVPNNLLIKIYYAVKDYGRLASVWESLVQEDPDNISYRKGLAGAYVLAGQKENAIKELKQVIIIDPSLEAEMNSYISQIQEGKLENPSQ